MPLFCSPVPFTFSGSSFLFLLSFGKLEGWFGNTWRAEVTASIKWACKREETQLARSSFPEMHAGSSQHSTGAAVLSSCGPHRLRPPVLHGMSTSLGLEGRE